MHVIGKELMNRLQAALPDARVYWEKVPETQLRGAVLSAELKQRKFTIQFIGDKQDPSPEALDDLLVEQVVDDFLDFFHRSIYPREKFTRVV
jgi:hypothetical protein